jgi:aconitate hydratase 2/2-methylisocitrate dehydratase
VKLLGTMQRGYNIESLVTQLDNAALAPLAVKALSHTLLMFDAFYDVKDKVKIGNAFAQQIMQSWADAQWFLENRSLLKKITMTVFKVASKTNTDDLSPAPAVWSCPDIPLHALVMLKISREGVEANEEGVVGLIKQNEARKQKVIN